MMSLVPGSAPRSRRLQDLLCSYLSTCLRNLDVDSGVSLPCLCTVNFLIANISMNSAPAPHQDRPKKASKKSLTQFDIL